MDATDPPDDATAEVWFVSRRWPDGVHCPHCGSANVQTGAKHRTMPYRCREKECGKRFSAKTVMEASKLGFQVWAIAAYLLSTSLKSEDAKCFYERFGFAPLTYDPMRLFLPLGDAVLQGSQS